MTDQARKYLSDIKRAIDLIDEFMVGVSDFSEYESDQKTKSAVERQLGIIGEAVNKYRKLEVLHELSSTRQIVNFRNRLIHSYDKVDDTIVWAILQLHLPGLKSEAIAGLNE